MFILTTGFGFITPIIVALIYFSMRYFLPELANLEAIALLVAAIPNWFIGTYFNNKPRYEEYSQQKSGFLKYLSKNTLFFVNMEWWSIILVLASLYLYFK